MWKRNVLLWVDDLLALGTLCPESGSPVVGLVLDEHVVGGDFSPAVRAQSERRRIVGGRGHRWYSGCVQGSV